MFAEMPVNNSVKRKIDMEHSSNLSHNDIHKLLMITVRKKKQEIEYPD